MHYDNVLLTREQYFILEEVITCTVNIIFTILKKHVCFGREQTIQSTRLDANEQKRIINVGIVRNVGTSHLEERPRQQKRNCGGNRQRWTKRVSHSGVSI